MRLYLSGPMTGIPDWNYPAFDKRAGELRDLGYEVLNPAENFGGDPGRDRADYMRLDVEHVLNSDAVAVLPGWEASKGAQLEVSIARELGLPILDALTFEPLPLDPPPEVFVGLEDAGPQVRVTSATTGGQKGRNLLRYGLIPWEALRALARHYGIGALKYDDDNWRRGYDWSLSIDALERHFQAWRGGESVTVERFEKDGVSYAIETHHLIAVAWQAFTLYIFERLGLGNDDRPL